jgi:hypothetical protein
VAPEVEGVPLDPEPMFGQWWVPPDDVEPPADDVVEPDAPLPDVPAPDEPLPDVPVPALVVLVLDVVALDVVVPVDAVDVVEAELPVVLLDDADPFVVDEADVLVTAPAMAAPPSTSPVANAPLAIA